MRARSFVWCGERKKGEKLKYSFVLATTFMEGAIENTKRQPLVQMGAILAVIVKVR